MDRLLALHLHSMRGQCRAINAENMRTYGYEHVWLELGDPVRSSTDEVVYVVVCHVEVLWLAHVGCLVAAAGVGEGCSRVQSLKFFFPFPRSMHTIYLIS